MVEEAELIVEVEVTVEVIVVGSSGSVTACQMSKPFKLYSTMCGIHTDALHRLKRSHLRVDTDCVVPEEPIGISLTSSM